MKNYELHPGDTIALIAPAYRLEPEKWEPIIPLLESWGLQVRLGKSLIRQHHVFAGTDHERQDDLIEMLTDPQVRGVLCVRGGYGCVRLLPLPDLAKLSANPKWLIGFSDITALHARLVDDFQWQSIHGSMPVDFDSESEDSLQSWNLLKQVLFGKAPEYQIKPHLLNRHGSAAAPVVGGNLSVIYGLQETPYQWKTKGCILLIEEVNESLHHLDRMMMNLKISGRLSQLAGLIVGSMTDMKDSNPSFGQTSYEIVASHVAAYKYPVVFGFPAGHQKNNYPLILGKMLAMEVNSHEATIKQ